MTDDLRQGAREALVDLGGDEPDATVDGSIEQASFEVRVGASRETVSLRMREGRLRTACTCGDSACTHLRAALRFVLSSTHAPAPALATRSIRPWAARPSLHPDPRRVRHPEPHVDTNTAALAEVLEDIVTAVVRAGVSGQSGLSVQDTLGRLLSLMGDSIPIGASRFIGRLRPALESSDVAAAATLLHAASAFARDLRSDAKSEESRQRKLAWLGAPQGDLKSTERLTDRTLLEIAREWVHGHERYGIERRYFVDVAAGEVYCEQRLRRGYAASVGPCPRLLGVGLAEAERGGIPRRIRLMQYTISVDIHHDTWQQLAFWGQRDFAALAQSYRAATERYAGFCEPFAVLAPAALARDAQPALLDEAGRVVPLCEPDEDGTLQRFSELTAQAAPRWVAGRLVEREGRMMLRPLAVGILRAERFHHERL